MKIFEGRLKYLTLFFVGGLADLSLAPFYIFPVLFISFPLLFKILNIAASKKQAFIIGWAFGYGYLVFGIYWIANSLLVDAAKFAWLIPLCVFVVPFGLAIYMGLFSLTYNILSSRRMLGSSNKFGLNPSLRWDDIVLFSMLWVIIEFFRGLLFTGFPWNLIGNAGLFSLWFAQSASLGGVYLLSFLVVLIALLPVYYKSKIFTGLVIIITLADFGFGYLHINQQSPPARKLKLLLYQPNIAESLKSQPELSKEQLVKSIQYLKKLDFRDKDMVIWPENGVPYDINNQPQVVEALEEVTPDNGLLITGAIRTEGHTRADFKVWNTLYAISQKGIYSFYDKIKLVPFGEFVPFRKYLPLDKITPGSVDFSTGVKDEPIKFNGFSFLPLICYEVIYPEFSAAKPRPDVLVNITNDGWFGTSTGPYQHLSMAQMRAIEQGLPLVRDANTGVSAVIDGNGRILISLPLGTGGVIDYELELRKIGTIYEEYGDKIIFGLFLIIMIVIFFFRKNSNSS